MDGIVSLLGAVASCAVWVVGLAVLGLMAALPLVEEFAGQHR